MAIAELNLFYACTDLLVCWLYQPVLDQNWTSPYLQLWSFQEEPLRSHLFWKQLCEWAFSSSTLSQISPSSSKSEGPHDSSQNNTSVYLHDKSDLSKMKFGFLSICIMEYYLAGKCSDLSKYKLRLGIWPIVVDSFVKLINEIKKKLYTHRIII